MDKYIINIINKDKTKKNSKKIDVALKNIKDYDKNIIKDQRKIDDAYKELSKEHAKKIYKDDKPSKKAEFKRDIELEKKIFEYLRTGVMPKGLNVDKINEYNEAKSAWQLSPPLRNGAHDFGIHGAPAVHQITQNEELTGFPSLNELR